MANGNKSQYTNQTEDTICNTNDWQRVDINTIQSTLKILTRTRQTIQRKNKWYTENQI